MFTDVRTVAVGVSDTDRAIEFFTTTLGFGVRFDAQLSPTMRWVEVAPEGASASVALLASDGPPVGIDTGIRFAVNDARAAHERLTGAGATVGEVLDFGGAPPMFTVTDPDGNIYYAVEESG
jgi:predicted enzyme related to lactoylglutathione lyase